MKEPNLRIFAHQEWGKYKNLRLRALADSPDAFGSTLAKEEKRPDTEWSRRLMGDNSSWNLPLLAEVDREPVGLAWGRIESTNPYLANLYQMWVSPTHRGLGLGKLLLDAVIVWAKEKNALYLDLGVTIQDSPAIRLYTGAGFKTIGTPEPLREGSKLLDQKMRLELRTRNI